MAPQVRIYKFVARAVDRVQPSFTRYEIRVSSSSNLLRKSS